MPAYNEEELIFDSIMTTLEVVSRFAPRLEIVAVNDGSKDGTEAEIMRAMKADARVKIVSSKTNHGKGAAIIAGVAEATGDYIAFLDADLELVPDQLESYIECMESKNADVVIGCKLHKDSHIEYPLKRKIISYGYYIMLRVLFHLNVKDTQTGIKLFRADALKSVAHLVRTSGFAYDIELLTALNRRGCKIEQMPVRLQYVREKGSKRIGFKDILSVFKDTWKIFDRVYIKKYYDPHL
jgi:glycosyltransferase involved in cell wall biosynthesis